MRKLLKGAARHDRLWVPATVSLSDDALRVSTTDQIQEFRVHRLVWMGPESFLVTGVDSGLKFKRIHLRMLTNSDAMSAASAIISKYGIQLETLEAAEEIFVEARFPLRGRELVWFSYQLVVRVLVGGFLFYAGIFIIGPLGFVASAFVLGFWVLIVYALVKRRKPRVDAWLKFEHDSLTIKSNVAYVIMKPKVVRWRSPEIFLLTGSRWKVEIYSRSTEEAIQLVSKIRAGFPGVREISDPKSSTSVQLGQTP